MGCGCKNCNGAVSQNTQLPPGCDSILSITHENIGSEILVTITLCSGNIQQFSIPLPADGTNGADGPQGPAGSPGVSIVDVDSSVADNIVTLTFTLSNGEVLTETFAIETQQAQAYVIDHVGLDVPNEDNISPTLTSDGPSQTIARSLIPLGSWPTSEDTIYFDILINLDYPTALGDNKPNENMFKNLQLQLNTDPEPNSSIGAFLELQQVGTGLVLFPINTLVVTGEITRRFIEDGSGNLQSALDIVATLEQYSARTYPVDNAGTTTAVTTPKNTGKNLAWSVKNTSVDVTVDNYLKVVALPSNYVVEAEQGPGSAYTVNPEQIYFTTRYLQRK